ncbi:MULTISPECIES: TetR/AcrR family transcriptional regulator [unclassified Rathayibacter]|uniref:TetR/AcrR family transcriptional regulator n=1 Tax=unclassified Rathayibacter TaxID=2609250 RepID=UPI000CE9361B|nr:MULTISPECIES: TetR/AcrR family transcriptional regulator [unclassified Rathayibacter]PPH15337.1 TetR family transcriptional regulator [Rathayibacter sp. AY1F8]PPH90552.1 TetR family transcriptional regulator [Rathayibacter sp. AY1D3]
MATSRTRQRVHAAVLDLVGTEGLPRLTMEGVAARAGVGKQTLYRSWPSTGAILFDALLARSLTPDGAVAVPDSGDLRADLLLLVTGTAAELSDPVAEPLLRAVTAAIQTDTELAAQYRTLLLEPQLSAIAARLASGGAADPSGAAELLLGPILHRWLLRSGPFTGAWVEGHVGRVVRALRA